MGVEEIYPKIPSAPHEEIQANHNAGIVNGYWSELRSTKEKLTDKYKKHCKRSSIACNYVSVAECVSTMSGVGALTSTLTVVGLPGSIAFGSLSTIIGLSILPTSNFIKRCGKKINKYSTMIDKLNSQGLDDGKIGIDEFKKIRDEYVAITREINKADIKSKNDQMRLLLEKMDGLEQKLYSAA